MKALLTATVLTILILNSAAHAETAKPAPTPQPERTCFEVTFSNTTYTEFKCMTVGAK